MANLSFNILLLLVCGSSAKPMEDNDVRLQLADEDLNRIDGDGDSIDLSHLDSTAYGFPNNESGENLSKHL